MARRQPSIMDSPFPLMMMALPTVETEIKQLTVDYQIQPPLSAVNKNIKKILKYCKLISYACNANRGSVQKVCHKLQIKTNNTKAQSFCNVDNPVKMQENCVLIIYRLSFCTSIPFNLSFPINKYRLYHTSNTSVSIRLYSKHLQQ